MNFFAIRHPTAIVLCLLGGAAVFAPTASAASGKSVKGPKSPKSPKSAKKSKSTTVAPTVAPTLSFRRRLLVDASEGIEDNPSLERSLEIIKSFEHLGAKPDAIFSKQHHLINKESCDALIQHLDMQFESDLNSGRRLPAGKSEFLEGNEVSWTFLEGDLNAAYMKKLYAKDLVELIGRDETLKILDFFYDSLGDVSIDCMYLTRHGAHDEDQYDTPYHVDTYSTMEITLNDNYQGGDVIHLTSEGAQKTNASPGTATAHTNDIIHGITPNVGGAKYMLILKHHMDRLDKEGVIRISREMVDKLTL